MKTHKCVWKRCINIKSTTSDFSCVESSADSQKMRLVVTSFGWRCAARERCRQHRPSHHDHHCKSRRADHVDDHCHLRLEHVPVLQPKAKPSALSRRVDIDATSRRWRTGSKGWPKGQSRASRARTCLVSVKPTSR